MSDFKMDGYVDVATRIAEFREQYPTGCLQPMLMGEPYRIESIGDQTFIVYVAAAYRSPEDSMPGVGCAWEQFPGRTPYTRGSELMNAETSAWGRAIVAVLAADTKRGIATADEVRNRSAERDAEPAKGKGKPPAKADAAIVEEIRALKEQLGVSDDKYGEQLAALDAGDDTSLTQAAAAKLLAAYRKRAES